jgi:hypothetical protein
LHRPFPEQRARSWRTWSNRLLLAACLLVAIVLAALDLGLVGSFSAVVFLLAGAGVAGLIWKDSEWPSGEPHRWIAQILIPLAFSLRGLLLAVAFSIEQADNLSTIGVDAAYFLHWGSRIAEFLPSYYDVSSYYLAGTYDIGFHYFLGFALWISGGDLLAVHTLLALFGAFCPYLLWQVGKPILKERAVWPALLLALSPLSVYLATVDLVKDGLLTFVFLLTFWAAQQILEGRVRRGWAPVLLVIGFLSARLIRSYVGLALEVGLLAFPLLFLVWRRSADRDRRRRLLSRVAILAVLFIGTEGALKAMGEPFAFQVVFANVNWLSGKRQAFLGSEGRFEALLSRRASLSGFRGGREFGDSLLEEGQWLRPVEPATPKRANYVLEVVRRTYGPYLWTPPTEDHMFHFLIGNWPAYLDTLLWYWAFPFGVCGAWFLVLKRRWDAALIAGFVLLFVLLLFIFNVSYRQRGSNLMPLLLIAAVTGWSQASRSLKKTILLVQAAAILLLAASYWLIRISAGLS